MMVVNNHKKAISQSYNRLLLLSLIVVIINLTTSCAKPLPTVIYQQVLTERAKLIRPTISAKPEVSMDVLTADYDNSKLLCYSLEEYRRLEAWNQELQNYSLHLSALLDSYELEIDQHNSLVAKLKLSQQSKDLIDKQTKP